MSRTLRTAEGNFRTKRNLIVKPPNGKKPLAN
jgi:hypothetical protein